MGYYEARKQRRIMELTEYCEKKDIIDKETIKMLAMRFYSVDPATAEKYAQIVLAKLLYGDVPAPVVL